MEKSQKCAILVECGFLSNAEEEAKLASPDYQKAMGSGDCGSRRDKTGLTGLRGLV